MGECPQAGCRDGAWLWTVTPGRWLLRVQICVPVPATETLPLLFTPALAGSLRLIGWILP